ncbi:SURF1 family protein [Novimethylophilus sp.]|uniref:SURF1 family protein n=1 Tax=Novimethylophilus sp. TaxID=2137426 RepID=UPI002F42B963
MKYQFRPQLMPTIAAVLLIIGMVKLGFWQYGKAQQKMALQAAFDLRLQEAPAALPETVANIEQWRYRRVRSKGEYEPRYQIWLDNQVDNENAGYHVITPFRAEGSNTLVLVDRGWIPMGDRSRLPQIETPKGTVEVEGFAWVPSTKFYELSPPVQSGGWQLLWQNMDISRYAKSVPFAVLPFVVRLDAASAAGGFARNWPKPAERIETNIGYAWQWWGFSVALALIWLFVNLKRKSP